MRTIIHVVDRDGRELYTGPADDPRAGIALAEPGSISRRVLDVADLIAAGGRFYAPDGGSYCDTVLATWRFVPGVGYVEED